MDVQITPEILLAQKLAGNTRKIREKALKRLKLYLETKVKFDKSGKGGFAHVDLLKLWKGLHYCMWMQDKPLLQEELSSGIASLVHVFGRDKTALEYVKCFYITECREWMSIDKWRMDKFLMMFRDVLTETFKFLKSKCWNEKLVNLFLDFLSSYIILDNDHTNSPDGVRFHLSEIWLRELSNVGFDTLGPKQSLMFFKPWIKTLAKIKCKTLKASILKNIFGEIILQSPPLAGPRKKSKKDKRLKFSYGQLAKLSMKFGSSEECTSYNREALYSLSQNFRDVASGKLPFAPEDEYLENVENITDDQIDEAVEEFYDRHSEFTQQNKADKKLHKRSKKMVTEVDEAYVSASGSSEEEQPSAKKAKMGKEETKKSGKKTGEKKGVLSKRLKQLMEAEQQYKDGSSDEESDPECDLTGMNSDEEEEELAGEEEEFSEGEAEILERGAEIDIDDIPSDEEFDMEDFLAGQDDGLMEGSDDEAPELIPARETKSKKSKPTESKPLQKIRISDTQETTDQPTSKPSKRQRKNKISAATKNTNNSNQISELSEVSVEVPAASEHLAASQGKTRKYRKKKKQRVNQQGEKQATSQKKEMNGIKPTAASTDFEVVDFDEPGDSIVLDSWKPITLASEGRKKKSSKKLKSDKSSEKIAKFVQSPDEPKATCLKMSSSRKKRKSDQVDVLKTPTNEASLLRKRISFGKSSSVKKTAVKLRGSSSHDPEKTPEQGILKVNPIQPGTVIQVGKQATLRNTLKNSKFPSKMMASF